jgi:hypothetical protein
MCARGWRGGTRGHGRCCGCGGGGRGSSAGPPEHPASLATLAAEHRVCMEASTPGVVLPHHTVFGLGEGVALLEVDLLGPAAVGGVTLCTNVATAIGVPTATHRAPVYALPVPLAQGTFLCLLHPRGVMACMRCCYDTQQACCSVSWQFLFRLLRSLGRKEFSLTLGRCLLHFALSHMR